MNKILLFFLVLGLASSCIPSQKTVYLQKDHPASEPLAPRELREYDFIYKLRPNDIISVKISSVSPSDYNFFSNAEKDLDERDPLLTGFMVDESGAIELPFVGNVEIAGLTLSEAKNKLKEVAAQYLESPTVNIRLLSFHFTVLGEVGKQGRYMTYNPKTTILEAIGMAGGLNDFAERDKIKIIRTEEDTTKIVYVNVLDEGLISSEFYYMQPNDVIAVSAMKTKDFRQNQAPNLALVFSAITAISLVLLNLNRIL